MQARLTGLAWPGIDRSYGSRERIIAWNWRRPMPGACTATYGRQTTRTETQSEQETCLSVRDGWRSSGCGYNPLIKYSLWTHDQVFYSKLCRLFCAPDARSEETPSTLTPKTKRFWLTVLLQFGWYVSRGRLWLEHHRSPTVSMSVYCRCSL